MQLETSLKKDSPRRMNLDAFGWGMSTKLYKPISEKFKEKQQYYIACTKQHRRLMLHSYKGVDADL